MTTTTRKFLTRCGIDRTTSAGGAKERVDVAAIRNFIDRHRPVRALIERAQAMPRQGSSSGFKYGRAVGAIEATVALCSIPMEIVEPSAWSGSGICRARTRKLQGRKPSNYSQALTQCWRASAITAEARQC